MFLFVKLERLLQACLVGGPLLGYENTKGLRVYREMAKNSASVDQLYFSTRMKSARDLRKTSWLIQRILCNCK